MSNNVFTKITDKNVDNALNEYKQAILDVCLMGRERIEAFDIEDGYCPTAQSLIELYSPAELIAKVEAYKERPKTGEVYVVSDGNKMGCI